MRDHKIEKSNKQIKYVTILGIIVNIALSALKFVFGLLAGSIALIADGVHSLSDMTTDLAVLLGIHLGSKQPDEGHPYGHGRVETFAAGFIALVLLFVGVGMIYYTAIAIARDNIAAKPNIAVFLVAIFSIVAKELLYRITKRVAVSTHSSVLYANAWHHRSDALSSIVVLAGFISLKAGFDYGDHIAAIGVGMMIILVAVDIISSCVNELTESAVDKETVEQIKEIINANTSIHQWHKLRTRTVGREVFLDLHILVEPDLNISAAHEIAENLENALEEQITRPINITVHIEPDIPRMRK